MSAHSSTRTAHRPVVYRQVRGDKWPRIMFTDRPLCECGEPFEPICPSRRCKARTAVLLIIRAEDAERTDATYVGHLPDGSWGRINRTEAMRQRRPYHAPKRRK